MKYTGQIKGSRTYDFAAVIAGFGALEQNLPMVREQLGDYYGFIFIAVAGIVAVLRKVTTGPVGESNADQD